MENLIWGLRTIAFSQLENEKGHSHFHIDAVDMQGEDTGCDVYRASCRMKIIGKSSSAHTIYFVSCDLKGKPTKVHCADGVDRVVTIALTHMDNWKGYNVGNIYESGKICYKEGSYSSNRTGTCGNHVHIEVAEGEVKTKSYVYIDGKRYWRFKPSVALKPTDVFFALDGYNLVRKDKLKSVNKDRVVTLKWVDRR